MKRKKDFANTSLATLILWAAREPHGPTKERIEWEIKERQKEMQQ